MIGGHHTTGRTTGVISSLRTVALHFAMGGYHTTGRTIVVISSFRTVASHFAMDMVTAARLWVKFCDRWPLHDTVLERIVFMCLRRFVSGLGLGLKR